MLGLDTKQEIYCGKHILLTDILVILLSVQDKKTHTKKTKKHCIIYNEKRLNHLISVCKTILWLLRNKCFCKLDFFVSALPPDHHRWQLQFSCVSLISPLFLFSRKDDRRHLHSSWTDFQEKKNKTKKKCFRPSETPGGSTRLMKCFYGWLTMKGSL